MFMQFLKQNKTITNYFELTNKFKRADFKKYLNFKMHKKHLN